MTFDLCEMGHLSRFHGSSVTLLWVICHAFEFQNFCRPKISWVICHAAWVICHEKWHPNVVSVDNFESPL